MQARRLVVSTVAIAMFASGWMLRHDATTAAQGQRPAGGIAGTVTAGGADVRAFRVKARDTVNRITYTVYTTKGKYQIFNLPPSTYEVTVFEEGFEAPTQTVQVTGSGTQAADLALTSKPDAARAELLDYDQLYPPGPARAILEQRCFGCHQPQQQWHLKGGKTEAGWRSAIQHMWDQDVYSKKRLIPWIKSAPMLEYPLTAEELDTVAKYFAKQFPPNHKRVDFATDTLVRDEDALSKAIFISYDLPPMVDPKDFSDPQNQKASRITHDPFVSTTTPGRIWLAGMGNSSFVAVDTLTLDYKARGKEWRIPHPENINVGPHAIIELNGKVYTVGVGDDALNELDLKTGKFDRWQAPTKGGGAHTLRADSKGNIWFTTVYGYSRVNKWDAKTRKVTEYNPAPRSNWYGIVVDKQDRVWVGSYTSYVIAMYDPKTDKWKTYPSTGTHRRLGVAPDGKIWAGQYWGNALTMIDPATEKVTTFKLPLKYGNPYEAWPDQNGGVWMDITRYNSLVRFDTASKKSTYFPYPQRAHAPKVEVDAQGTVWFGGVGNTATAFKQRGNVPSGTKAD